MADSDKIVVEVTKQEAPPKEPNFSWWICWRDKREDKEFKCLTVDEVEQVSREVDRLGGELSGRQIWVSTTVGAYSSRIVTEMAKWSWQTEESTQLRLKSGCVN